MTENQNYSEVTNFHFKKKKKKKASKMEYLGYLFLLEFTNSNPAELPDVIPKFSTYLVGASVYPK